MDDVNLLREVEPKEKVIVLTHNPDTTSIYPEVELPNLVTMTGHTYCGQARVPGLCKKVIPTRGLFYDGGVCNLPTQGDLIITCGLGEIGLPIRFLNRPEILRVKL